MTRAEQYKKKACLNTALRNGAGVLAAIDKYEHDKNKQGIYIQLDHETHRTLVNICFPEIEQEILEVLKSRYTRLMQMWNQELRNTIGEITDDERS